MEESPIKEENEGMNLIMPFTCNDIIEINPLVKHLDISSDDVQANMEIVTKILIFLLLKKKNDFKLKAQKFLVEGKVKEAMEAFQNSIQLLLNVKLFYFSTYIHVNNNSCMVLYIKMLDYVMRK